MVNIDQELWAFWDYKKYSKLKRLQRIGMFFPQIGRDIGTLKELYGNLNKLQIPQGHKRLIEFYFDLIKEGKIT